MANDQTTVRRWAIVLTVVLGLAFGIVWDVLAAAVLFRSYSFFESVVVCLLVMILCAVATMRADFEPGGLLQRPDVKKDTDASSTRKESDVLHQLRALLRVLFYGIAFVMALIKLVLALIDSP